MKRNFGNPDRAFAQGFKHCELTSRSFGEIIDYFDNRITNWYFNVARQISPDTDSNFMVTATCCILIDLFSQYFYGQFFSSKKYFIKFFADYLGRHNQRIKSPIKTLILGRNGSLAEIKIETIAEGLYIGFRCGVVHSARILEFGRINRNDSENAIVLQEWTHNGQVGIEIQVNPLLLLNELEVIFKDFLQRLRNGDSVAVKNFKQKFNFEYGTTL